MFVPTFVGALAVATAVTHPRHAPHPSGIPSSVREEHQELHAELQRAMKRKDAVGKAARELSSVLHSHFLREEEIALPPLGAIALLARNEMPPNATELVAMCDALERELPGMLEEHRGIAAALRKLQRAAVDAGADRWVRFAKALHVHAKTEEEILYPAAILVGRMLRARA